MIKKLIIIFCIIFLNMLPSMASVEMDYLSNVEKNLFSSTFSNETIQKRLDRIEINVFGVKSVKNTTERIKVLKTTIGNFAEPKPTKTPSIKKKPVIPVNNSIKYPVIDKIETAVLSKTYSNEDIYNRLDRLELLIFNQKSNLPLNERVERLNETILGKNMGQHSQPANIVSDEEIMTNVLDKIEQETFNTVYQNESIETRLDRLENKIFNSTSPDDEVQDRIERLAAVITAQPTNELYKDMSTIRQYNKAATVMTILLLILQGLL